MSLSLRARLVEKMIPKIMPGPEVSPEEQRAKLDRGLALPNRRVEMADLQVGGVPAVRFQPKGALRRRHLLHFHGGGFVVGTARGFGGYLGDLALRTDAVVTSIDYRLAPEHPYPAAIDDCLAAYRATLDEVDLGSLAIIGESAGGNAVVATLLRAHDVGLSMPAAMVLLSPWLDLTFSGESMQRNETSEIMLERRLFTSWRDSYVAGADPADPGISPLFADLAGLPPTHVQATAAEVLEDDARRFAERAGAAGVDVDLVIHEGLWHVFQTMPFVPEASDALERVNGFVRAHTRG